MSDLPAKKRDIYVILSGSTPLHAVYTERQAKRLIETYGHPTEDCRLFLGLLSYHKIKLIPPRKVSEKTKESVKKTLQIKVDPNYKSIDILEDNNKDKIQ